VKVGSDLLSSTKKKRKKEKKKKHRLKGILHFFWEIGSFYIFMKIG